MSGPEPRASDQILHRSPRLTPNEGSPSPRVGGAGGKGWPEDSPSPPPRNPPTTPGGASLAFVVDDLGSANRELTAKGIRFREERMEIADYLVGFSFWDSEGNRIYLVQIAMPPPPEAPRPEAATPATLMPPPAPTTTPPPATQPETLPPPSAP